MVTTELTQQEVGTILAALRHYQFTLDRAPRRLSPEIRDIANDSGTYRELTADEIDDLCEKINL